MSNIAGKAYAMNVITPVRWYTIWLNKLILSIAGKKPQFLKGLTVLSLIHYAGWVLIGRKQFPHLDEAQPKENLQYSYMMFFSNFNGSWNQYVDSFTFAIPSGLDLFWKFNIRYPHSVPLTPFHKYIQFNQVQTSHYYNAYPMATANDVKAAARVKDALIEFDAKFARAQPEQFAAEYRALLRALQCDLGDMYPATITRMSASAIARRRANKHAEAPPVTIDAPLPVTAVDIEKATS
ncbi:MAG: hypothetical protein JWP59_4268 [Massilia sp.]|nr:hypothetical protein [Massilia sp.]